MIFLSHAVGGASSIMGHGSVEEAVRIGLDGRIHGCYVRMKPWRTAARWVAQPIPGLFDLDLDMHELRWHAVEALRGHTALARALRSFDADAVFVNSHSLAFGMGGAMKRRAIVLSADASVLQWAKLAVWTKMRPYTEAVLVPALAMERRALDRAALVLAWSEWTRRGLLVAAPNARVVVHHPGVDSERFVPAEKHPRRRPRILFVGARFREKGGLDLLEAIGPLLDHQLELDIVTPEEVPPRPGIRVHRLYRDDPRMVALYQQADLLCLPTRGDTVPWVLLEAMACGTAVVSTSVGAIPEILAGGRIGVTVPPGDVHALREAITSLLSDDARRRRLAGAGRHAVEEGFDARRRGPELHRWLAEAARRHAQG